LDLTPRTGGRACEAVDDSKVSNALNKRSLMLYPGISVGLACARVSTQMFSTGTLHKTDEAVLTGRSSDGSGDCIFGRCEERHFLTYKYAFSSQFQHVEIASEWVSISLQSPVRRLGNDDFCALGL
jgi:hypothetical protein